MRHTPRPGSIRGCSTATLGKHKEFAYEYPPPLQGMRAVTHGGAGKGYCESGAKLEFWQNSQRNIRGELQKRLDQGWEPVGEVCSACIEIKKRRSHPDKTAGHWIMYLLFSIPTLGGLFFWALINVSEIAEPTRLVLQMRRPAQA